MWILLTYLFISILVPTVMGLGSFLVSSKFMSADSFECGFDSFNVSVFPVSLRFFIFCIVFLILDLELIIMSFTPLVLWSNGFIINIVLFLFLVTLSMLLEWMFGSLSWVE
uniref:NADH-ubiquinone oxidoreductase chain 3 n=1 Tax=Macrotrachela quadricornifera TaxID=104788 RepID=J7KJZ1_9BILA|nr:NADH dehydrogenase subunit 3 [Macrotrachela quadricornifera]AFQ96991.1 NADH dehydrogenase subunit 3 [Macrotrachela quadricornifera]AFQ96992.1 NADH dehydrogenase subunit 3 [Macrotrachela quadricornifera]AFQ96993.1 NADH dehydrogenase subunit 3 [Macrotrachela quadricornifera]AFQ96996.1 NADH dehydrogenase subunit 3 [Macrotrachela quadricornifera]